VKERKDCTPDAEDHEVPKEEDGDVKVVCSDEWKDGKDCGGNEGEAADDDGSDLRAGRQLCRAL
jgi:hypothetical protein